MDGEVDSVALSLAGQDLTVTIGRTVGIDLTDTQTLPGGGLPLAGGTLDRAAGDNPGDRVRRGTDAYQGQYRQQSCPSHGPPGTIKPPPANAPSTPARDGEFDYFEVNGRLGGSNAQAGIGIGPGGNSGRDVTLYRDEADVWRTPDAFHVGELRVDAAGQANSRTQLGLGTAAVADTGTGSGDVPVLNASGDLVDGVIPAGIARDTEIFSGSYNDLSDLPTSTSFDIHDDITTGATIVDADRVPFSDEGSAGDPMRYTTAESLADYMQAEIRISATVITSDTLADARIPSTIARDTEIFSGAYSDLTGHADDPGCVRPPRRHIDADTLDCRCRPPCDFGREYDGRSDALCARR